MKHIFDTLKEHVSDDQFKDSVILDSEHDPDERYTAIESDEETPVLLPHRPVRTNIEMHHDATKARRYVETYKATVGTAKVAETVAIAAATHGVASPLVLEDAYKTGRALRAVKKNYDAVRALSPSLNHATNEQIDAADEIIENAIKNSCLLTEDKKPWHERVDIVKKSKIYANVLQILINEVSPEKLKEAEPVVTELIVEHFNANIVYKHPSRNFMKEGGRKHLSFSDETTKNLYPEVAQALGKQFNDSVELEGEDSTSPKSRRQERKEQSRSSLPDHIRKEASTALSRAGSRSSSSFSERVQRTSSESKKEGFDLA